MILARDDATEQERKVVKANELTEGKSRDILETPSKIIRAPLIC